MTGYVALRNGKKILMDRIPQDDDMCPVISVPFPVHKDHVNASEKLCGFDVIFDVVEGVAINIRKFTFEEWQQITKKDK